MEKMVAFCGLTCTDCKTFIATQEDDDIKRREVAEAWSKTYGLEIKPEEINCDGCLTKDGRLFIYCSVCKVRKCGTEKEVQNCAYCDEYKCEKLTEMLEIIAKTEKTHATEAEKTLEEIRQRLQK